MKKILFFAFLLPFTTFAKDINCQAQIQPESFSLNDQAYLVISANKNIGNATFDLPNSTTFRLRYESQSSQASLINGKMEYTSSLYFRILPAQTGTFDIPEFQGKCNDETFIVPATKFSVTNNSNNHKQPYNAASSIDFLIQGDFQQKLYVGQSYPIQVQLLTPPNLRGQLLSFPQKQGDAFSIAHLIDEPKKTNVNIQGRSLTCLFWPVLVTNLQSGTFPLSFSLNMEIEQPTKTRRLFDDDPLDILSQGFSGMFGHNEPISISTKPKTIQVLPLPLPQPVHFNHAIGDFQLSTPQVKEKEFIQNEPLTLCLKVGGQGNFENIQAPTLQYDTTVWRMYDPKSSFESKDFLGYKGNLTFEYTLVPLKDGLQELPKASFCFFNPHTGQYETLERTALSSITVKPAIHATVTEKIISFPINQENKTQITKSDPILPTIFIDKLCWETESYYKIYICFLIGFTFIFCLTSYQNYRQKNDKKYIQKKLLKDQFKYTFKTLENAFKQKDGTLFYVTVHELLELLLKEKNANLDTILNQDNCLSNTEKNLIRTVELTYRETQFGGKQCPCPEDITPFKKLIQTLK